MSGEVNGAAATAPTQKKENQDAPAPAASTANSNPPKLSGAEIKAKKQAEKAARRAQAVAAKAAVAATSGAPVQGAQTGGDNKGNKQSKPKADGQAPSGAPASARPTAQRRQSQSTGQRQPAPLNVTKDVGPTIPECFSHLSMAKRIPLSEADKDVHPVVLAVGQQMATFTLRDNIARLRATLLAFKKVGNVMNIVLLIRKLRNILGYRNIREPARPRILTALRSPCSQPTDRVPHRMQTYVLCYGQRY